MPIIWRYLLSQYLKVLLFCAIAFIAVLLTTRFHEIAHFATLGAEGIYILWFIYYQVIYILPVALPIAGLISALLLVQRLSQSYELTAFRACGVSIRDILIPILFAASCLTVINLYLVSEMATHSHLATSLLKNELRSINPLLLLHNKNLMQLKGVYSDTLGQSRMGEFASDIVIALPDKNNKRIKVMVAKQLQATPLAFIGHDVSLISSMKSEDENFFDHFMIENMQRTETLIQDFSQILQKKVWTLNKDYLKLPLLLVQLHDDKEALQMATEKGESTAKLKQMQKGINRCYSEIMRRFSLSIAVWTFTLMGAAFGITISRYRSIRNLVIVISLAAFYLTTYFVAEGMSHLLVASLLLYFIPHLIIILLSVRALTRIARGIE